MNGKLRTALLLFFTLVFLGSGAMVVYRIVQYQEGEEIYDEAAQLVDLPALLPPDLPQTEAESPPLSPTEEVTPTKEVPPVYVDPYADALRNMDFTALRQVNDDVLGWILVPGTHLSYPLVQGDDNSYYLNRTWKKSHNSVGAIFMECQNSGDLTDFNTIIYGHRMNDRSMFGTLKYYKDQSYWSSHPCIYITNDSGSHKYEIFSAYEVSVTGDTYRLGFSTESDQQSYIDYCLAQSVISTGITPTVYDRILTLSTCTGNGHTTRWVVQGVLRGVAPSDGEQTAEPLPPTAAPQGPVGPSAPQEPSPLEGSLPPEDAISSPQSTEELPAVTPPPSAVPPDPDTGDASPLAYRTSEFFMPR